MECHSADGEFNWIWLEPKINIEIDLEKYFDMKHIFIIINIYIIHIYIAR